MPPSGDEANGTQHVQVCDGRELSHGDPAKVYAIRTNGQVGYEVLDVTDPAKPAFLTTIAATGTSSRPNSDRGNRETHKFQWDCSTGVAYMNGTAQDWRVTRVLQAFDVSDPQAPKHIRDFALEGYEPTAAGPMPEPEVAGLHQPFVVGKRMYLGYNSGDDGVLQIVDTDKFLHGDPAVKDPLKPTAENLHYPQISRYDMPSYWGVHTAKPIYGFEIADYADNRDARTRDLLLVSSESETFRCQEPRDVMTIFDITEEHHPSPISTFQVPEEPGDFCHRGGRFGRTRLPTPTTRSSTRRSSCSRTSMPACASSTFATRSSRRKLRASSPRSRPTPATRASRSQASVSARRRSRRTT